MDEGEKIGLTGTFESAQFEAGLAKYLAAVEKAAKGTEMGGKQMEATFAAATKKFTSEYSPKLTKFADDLKSKVVPATKEATKEQASLGLAAAAMAGAVGGIAATATQALLSGMEKLANVVPNVVNSLKDLIVQGTLAAARNDEMGMVSKFMGAQAGYSAEQIDKVTDSLKKGGATTADANDMVTQFARSNMDLAKSTDLLKVAQGAGIISGQGTSAMVQQLISGIVTLQPKMIRSAGIIIDATTAYEVFAKSVNTSVDALTGQQKQQAILNAVLQEGGKASGLYAEAMKLPGKQLRSLTDRLIPELIAKIGGPFQDAFAKGMEAINGFVKWLTEAISEGGKLYPVLQLLGSVASFLADMLSKLSEAAIAAGEKLNLDFGKAVEGLANNALVWGQNVIVQFANGILAGAGDALASAMNAISDMLSSWLAPGSPPKVAPDITQWGAGAIGEWLHGFTEADFSVLSSIQGPLQSALTLHFGEAGKEAAKEAFSKLSGEILSAIDAGSMSKKLFNEIAEAGGGFGKQIAILVKDQIDLANATKEVKTAQDALTEAQNQSSAAGAKVSEATKEYNAMLRSGASKEALAAKLLEIKAAEKAKVLADKAAVTASATLGTASEKEKALKETLATQEALVAQQQKLAAAEGKPAGAGGAAGGAAAKAGGGLKAAGGGALKVPKLDIGDHDKVVNQVEELKNTIIAKFKEMWDGAVQAVSGIAERIMTYFQPAIDNVKGGLAEMFLFWNKHKGEVEVIVSTLWEMLKSFTAEQLRRIGATIKTGLDLATGLFQIFWDVVNGDWVKANTDLKATTKQFLDDLFAIFGASFDDLKAAWAQIGLDIGTIIGTFIGEAIRAFGKFKDDVYNKFNEIIASIKGAFALDWSALGKGIIDGIIKGVTDAAGGLAQAAANAVGGAIAAARNALGMHSPSKVFMDIGKGTMEAMGAGIQRGQRSPQQAMTSAMARTAAPAALVPVMSGSTSNINMNMGGVSIYNPMNMAMFESMLNRALSKARA